MGGIVGKVTDAIGLTDYGGAEDRANQAAQQQAQAAQQSLAVARENIDFQREQLEWQKAQYNDWKSVYGDLSSNLGEYYNQLSGETIAAQQLSATAQEFARAQEDVQRQLAQRGMSDSGTAAAATTALATQEAATRANIRATADQQAAQQKAGFLGIGLGQGTQMLGIQAQQAGTISQAATSGAGIIQRAGQLQMGAGMQQAQTTYQVSQAMGQDIGRVAGMMFG